MTEAADLIDAVADLGAVLGRTTFPAAGAVGVAGRN